MLALSMYEEYLMNILNSKKTDDVRLYNTKNRGKIALIKSRTSLIYGYVELISTSEISYEEYILWHINSTFSRKDAEKWIELNKSMIKNKKAYKYNFVNPMILEHPKKVKILNANKSWIEYEECYEQLSLF